VDGTDPHRDELDATAELELLSFAARLLLSQLDRRLLLEAGLESFLDFARGRAGAVYLLDLDGERLRVACAAGTSVAVATGAAEPERDPAPAVLAGHSPWREALTGRMPRAFPLGAFAGAPCPLASGGAAGRECLCVPLVGGVNRVLGAVAIDRDAAATLEKARVQSLLVLQSILALGLEQAAARESLLAANEELEALNAAKSKMIDHLSHELKTPLAVLSASTALLGRAAVRGDETRAAAVLERMDRGLRRLLELQEEARDIAEARAGDVAAAQEIELERWLPDVLASIAPLHRHRGVRVETVVEPTPPLVVAEPLLRKAVIGLARNAIEATADGGWVRVAVAPSRDGIVLEVADSGVGFDQATRRQLFSGFVHAGETSDYSSRRPYDYGAGGRGLDLLRTRHFAERQGFAIEVESEPGVGSRFRLVFPRSLVRARAPASAAEHASAAPRDARP
jgi:signal transduction histidine kinase